MDKPLKNEPKSCFYKSCTRDREYQDDDQVNQEVPPNFQNKVPIQRQFRQTEPTWSTDHSQTPTAAIILPTAKRSEELNWQAGLTSVVERNAVMFNNTLMADIYFNVGKPPLKQKIPAHKYILASGSSVFQAMFFGGLSDKSEEIDIPDVEPAAFLNLLRYLYCDEIKLESDNVMLTLYAAKKYLVPALAKACVRFLETRLSANNACLLLSQGRLFEEEELMQRCWEVIDAQAEEALTSEGFTEMDMNTLKSVLTRETLNAKEISVFNACVQWADAECRRKDINPTAENKRFVLSDAIYLIRFPAMTLQEYADGPAQSGILRLEESHKIFIYFSAKRKPDINFLLKARKGLQPCRCHRFQSSAYRSNQWRYRGRCDSIQFAVDRRVFVAGFGLYGSSNGAAEYHVKMELKKSGAVLGHKYTKYYSDGSSNTFSILFDNPIQIESDQFYNASVILEGNELSYFGQEGLAEVQTDKVTFQFQCSSESTNGTGVQGGQIPEIIFYC